MELIIALILLYFVVKLVNSSSSYVSPEVKKQIERELEELRSMENELAALKKAQARLKSLEYQYLTKEQFEEIKLRASNLADYVIRITSEPQVIQLFEECVILRNRDGSRMEVKDVIKYVTVADIRKYLKNLGVLRSKNSNEDNVGLYLFMSSFLMPEDGLFVYDSYLRLADDFRRSCCGILKIANTINQNTEFDSYEYYMQKTLGIYSETEENEFMKLLSDFGKAVNVKKIPKEQPQNVTPSGSERKEIEITYSVTGYEEADETTFEMKVSSNDYDRLVEAENEEELLDAEYVEDKLPKLHVKIIKAIRHNMSEESLEPNDGMVTKRRSWGAKYEEYSDRASHESMLMAPDEDIEYTIDLV